MSCLTTNINSARIDLCLAVDQIDGDLRRLVEYLNRATRADVRVTAVQLAYARQGEVEILIPSTYGGEIAETKGREAGRETTDWTLDSFLEALKSEYDKSFAKRILELATSAEGPGRRAALWFGNRPGGGIYLHPGGVGTPPAWISVNSKHQLTICGTWKTFPRVAHHPAYADLARLLGQEHTDGAKGSLAATLDLEELWPVLVDCGLALDAAATESQ